MTTDVKLTFVIINKRYQNHDCPQKMLELRFHR